jgi:hypothetical protein
MTLIISDFGLSSPSPFPLPSREGIPETLSPGGRGQGEGVARDREPSPKLAPMPPEPPSRNSIFRSHTVGQRFFWLDITALNSGDERGEQYKFTFQWRARTKEVHHADKDSSRSSKSSCHGTHDKRLSLRTRSPASYVGDIWPGK